MSVISIKKEVLLSLLFRLGGMGIALLTTSLLIKTLGATNYGVWATLVSLLAWIQLSDFGVGYALKNRIAGKSNSKDLINLVSGVFQFFVLVSIGLALVFLIFGGHLKIVKDYPLESWVLYVATFVFFPLTIGTSVLQGLRRNSVTAVFGFAQAVFWLMSVMLLAWLAQTLIVLTWAYVVILVMLSLGQFIIAMRGLSEPNLGWVNNLLQLRNLRLAFPLCVVGLRFIVLQLSSVVLFSLGTYLTYSNLSAQDAAKFDVMFKFFQVPLTIFNMIISVYWVEIAHSISLKDSKALMKRYQQLISLALVTSLLTIAFAVLVMPNLIDMYSGRKIQCKTSDTFTFASLISIQLIAYSGAVFLNAAEMLKGQIVLAILAASLLLPVALFFFGQGVGMISVPLATSILIFPSLIYCNWAAYFYVIKKNS